MSTEPRPWRIGDYEISGEEIADIVWLASFLEESRPDEAVGSGARADQNNLEAVSNAAASTTRNKVGKETSGQNKSKAPDEVTGAEGQQGRLYTAAPATSGGVRTAAGSPTLSGLSFPTPRAPGLSERPAFMRSLRPLLQRQPSRSRFEIDEDVTAERIANAMGQAWVPALRPLAERMFDLILLIEESPSMGVWRDTVRDLRVVLIQTGIFRDVNTWAMVLEETAGDSDTRSVNMSLRVAQAVPGVARRIYEPGELIDPQQRRLILVLSDCCSPAWDNGTAMRLLKPLTTVNAVSIVQLLPEELWDITALTNAVQVTLFSRQIFTSNSQLEVQNLPKGVQSEQLTENPSIPVVTLAPRELNSWAHFVMGRRQERATGYYFHAHSPGDEPVGDIDVEAELNDLLGVSPGREGPTVDARYSHFLSTVPPRARRLAAHFAAAPLTIPIMRMVQSALMQETTHADFVRVYYSSLIERISPFTAESDIDHVQYDFAGGEAMRRRLLDSLPRHRIEQVQEILSRYVEEKLDQLDTFKTALHVPGVAGNVALDGLSRHVAEVSASVLRYLGGIYSEMADRLERSIDPTVPVVSHHNGEPVWVVFTLPNRTEVMGNSVLSVKMYSSSPPPPEDIEGRSIHALADLTSGTEVELHVEAPDGGFVLTDTVSPAPFVTNSSAGMAPRNVHLQANALGEAHINVALRTGNQGLANITLSCAVFSRTEDRTQSLGLRLEGDSLYERGAYSAAEEKYTVAVLLGEDARELYECRGDARQNLGKYPEAEADYSAAIKRGSNQAWIFMDRGKVLRLQKKYDAAIRDFSNAIRLSPGQASAYHERGFSYYETQAFNLAENDFSAALELTPTAILYRNRGLCRYQQLKYDDALADYDKAIELDRGYTATYRSRAQLHGDMNNIELAIIDYTTSLEYEQNASDYNSRGALHEGLKDYEAALADYAQAIELAPDYKWAYKNRGGVYFERGEYEQAITEYTRALEADPSYASAYNGRGLAYEKLSQAEAALADFARAIRLDPNDKWAYDNRGDIYRERGQHAQAIAEYTEAIRIDPSYARGYDGRGLSYQALGQTGAALADFSAAVKAVTDYKWAYRNQGEVYRERREYEESIAAFNKALAIDPAYDTAYLGRSLTFSEMKNWDAAIADLEKAIEVEPNDVWLYINRIRVLKSMNGADSAEKEAMRLLERFPDQGLLFHELADLYARRGATIEAREAYARAAYLYGQELMRRPHYRVYINRGLAFKELYRWDQAIKDFSEAIAMNNAIDAIAERADCYLDTHVYDKAAADYKRAIEMNPRDAYLYYNLAIVYLDQEDYNEALSQCQRGIEIDPQNAHGYMIRGYIQARRRNSDAAVKDAQHALSLEPEDPQVLRFSCSIYCWAGLYEAAIGYGQQAIEHQSGEASAFLWLGHSFFLAGSLTAARDNYIRAIELAPDSYFYRFTISQIPKLMRSRSIADENVQGIIQLFQQAIADLDRARTE